MKGLAEPGDLKSKGNSWIPETLQDIVDYAEKNQLSRLAGQLRCILSEWKQK